MCASSETTPIPGLLKGKRVQAPIGSLLHSMGLETGDCRLIHMHTPHPHVHKHTHTQVRGVLESMN